LATERPHHHHFSLHNHLHLPKINGDRGRFPNGDVAVDAVSTADKGEAVIVAPVAVSVATFVAVGDRHVLETKVTKMAAVSNAVEADINTQTCDPR